MNKIREISAVLDCLIAVLEEFLSIDDDNVYTAPFMADKDILEFFQSSKNMIEADSEDKNELKIADSVPTSSELRSVVKSMGS
ncbi:hypothetical protein TNCV_2909051 [Trichonephila clavipes]|nr:hypothetical protein TNCV_2909051 [Trichonephila clavipes]